MDKKEDIRSVLREVSRDCEEDLHLSEAELMEYQRGRVELFERERIQAHLVKCDRCQTAFKAVKKFLEPESEES
jgi:hypothetical protein